MLDQVQVAVYLLVGQGVSSGDPLRNSPHSLGDGSASAAHELEQGVVVAVHTDEGAGLRESTYGDTRYELGDGPDLASHAYPVVAYLVG